MAESDDDTLSPRDMRVWLEQEIQDLTKAMELRIQDATDFVTRYATGELDAKAARERLTRYTQRWGDAIPGVNVGPRMTNKQVLDQLDRTVASHGCLRINPERGGASRRDLRDRGRTR